MSFTILDTFVKNGKSFYHCICDECGAHKDIRKERFADAKCNCILHCRPDLVPFMKDKEDAERFSPGSSKKIEWKCPVCADVQLKRIVVVSKWGYSCPCCSTTISFPNRYMYSLLKHIGEPFEREKIFEWSDLKRYDFYLEQYSMIIEMHGEQHYNRKTYYKSLDEIQKEDEYKKFLAIKNGILNYIVIDSRISDGEYIFNNICNSVLVDYFNLKSVNNDLVIKNANAFVSGEVLALWNKGISSKKIAKELDVSYDYVLRILKNLSRNGICDYDKETELKKSQALASEARKKPVMCLNDGLVFQSIKDATEHYCLSRNSITNQLNGWSKSCSASDGTKLYFKYLEE